MKDAARSRRRRRRPGDARSPPKPSSTSTVTIDCRSWQCAGSPKTKGVRTFGSTAAEIVCRGATLKYTK